MVVNPKAVSKYGEACMQRSKTDAKDTLSIMDYAERMPFVPWQAPSEQRLQLQALTRRIDQLKQEIIREQSRNHAQSDHIRSTRRIARDIQVNIRHLKRRIAYLEDQALDLVLHDETFKRAYQRLLDAWQRANERLAAFGRVDPFCQRRCNRPSGSHSEGLDPKSKL